MLVAFTTHEGVPLWVNPRYVVAVCEDKHYGRPGVARTDEYSDTLIVTTKGEFNVQEEPAAVARLLNEAMRGSGQEMEATE